METTASKWNRLTMYLAHRPDGLHITAELLTHDGALVPLYSLDQPSSGQGTDVGVSYNNFSKGRNKPHVTCTDQTAIFTQITSPAAFESAHKLSRVRIPPVTKKLQKWLPAMLFLDPQPVQMRDYAFPSDALLHSNGRNVSAVLFNLWGRKDQADIQPFANNRQAILEFIQSLPEQIIAGLSFLEEPRGGVMVKLTDRDVRRPDKRLRFIPAFRRHIEGSRHRRRHAFGA